jgi:hypothetical protein
MEQRRDPMRREPGPEPFTWTIPATHVHVTLRCKVPLHFLPCGLFRAGVSSATCSYLSHYTWQKVWPWMRHKHRKPIWKQLRGRYCGGDWWPATEERVLIALKKISTTRYR